ncbi:cytochrome c oxidase subunit 7A2, mitochondrial [Podarcis muralis]|uniref:Cytochrome c oxidase subunit 7A2, mitochondrial n=1 Tax=Podarcis lilfordi TaxID=74358 RepID=A0AA35P2A6_9SAUR|nr:cytochrome c oxidase subunit 7A2, mitochondrial [Podarcis muralis]XP_053237264.1 cytochrome c oxidase subunit 7A2, mitochondrial [Podarcis raffonei]CAI5769703.1 cytochrome c oxidase subunit 7A2, mitochondrial [Podarcis lilfordi]
MLRNLLTLRQISQKSISTASRRQVTNKVPELQKHFQEDNGIPVYLKGGTMDAMLYRTTMILSVFGTGYLLYVLFNAAMPKKNN